MANPIIDLRKEQERRDPPAGAAARANAARQTTNDKQPTTNNPLARKDATSTEDNPASEAKPLKEGEVLEWEAYEYEHHKKDEKAWIRKTTYVAIPLAILMLLMKNVLGFVVVALGAAAFLLSAFRPPQRLTYRITKDGIIIGSTFRSYKVFTSFWIFSGEQGALLSLKRDGVLGHPLAVPMDGIDPDRVREILSAYLPEEEQQPSQFDAFLRRIGY